MKYRNIKDKINVSEISLGCWTLGGLNWSQGHSTGWSDVDENEIKDAIDYALDNGVNHFDNADCYGNGKAECLLANILGARSNNVIISSKVGHFRGTANHAYESAHIRHQCEQSLINLKREFIDIYYFHHGNFGENDEYLEDAIITMNRLKEEGKIRLIGLSAYTTFDFTRLVPQIKPDIIQSWAHVMDDKFIADKTVVRQLIEKENIPFVAFSPLNQGLLLGKYSAFNPPVFSDGDHRKDREKFSKKALEDLEPKMDMLKKRFGNQIKELARIALQYVLYYPVVACVIPGFRNKKQVEMNLQASNNSLTEEDVKFIRELFK